MALDGPSQQTSRASHSGDSDQEPSPSRIYDSFIVRLWRDGSSTGLLRAEVEHVQTGLLIEEIQAPWGWILSAIRGCLQPPVPHQPHDAAGNAGELPDDPRPTS